MQRARPSGLAQDAKYAAWAGWAGSLGLHIQNAAAGESHEKST